MNVFQILTPITYWLLVGLWVYILGFLLQRLRRSKFERSLLNVLIIILAINALRTLFESIYFGAWFTSKSGFLPIGVYDVLVRPEIVMIPKVLNVITAVLIIGILLNKWFPAEKRDRELQENSIKERTRELRESEERFRMICENAPVLINSFNEEGRCLLWNKQCRETFGWSIDELNAQPDPLALFYPDPSVRDEVLKATTNDPDGNFREWNPVTKEGRTLTTTWANFRLPSGMVFGLGHDITERKQAERERQSKQYHLENAQSLGEIGSWDLDVEKNELIWTDENYRIFGMPIGTPLTYELFLSRVHLDDREVVDSKWSAAMRGGKAYDIEHRLMMDDGEVKWVREKASLVFDDSGNCIKGTGFTQNITERKQAEETLRQSEATIRNKLKAITEGDIGTLELTDMMDTTVLQSIMEECYQLTGMLGAVLDISGNILVAVGWQDICTQFHRVHPESCKNCLESDTCLTDGVAPGTFKAYRCKNHMWDMVTPLVVGGRHIGNVFVGQFFYDDEIPDVELFREQAKKYGFDEVEYLAALQKVPRFSREKAQAGMRFYSNLSEIISTLSFSAIQQARLLTERQQAEKNLRNSESKFRALFEQSGGYCMILDPNTANGIPVIMEANQAACDIHGYTRETFVGRPVTDIDDEEGRRLTKERTLEIMTGKPFYVENEHIRKDGTTFSVAVNAKRIDIEDEPPLIFTTEYDITERKLAENNLARHQATLESDVLERTQELREIVNAMAGRENRMADLKEIIKQLCTQLEDAGMTPVTEDTQVTDASRDGSRGGQDLT